MSKQTKIVVLILGALILLTGALLIWNRPSAKERQELAEGEKFIIKIGDQSKEVTMADIEEIKTADVEANYKPSGKAPVTRVYQGVPFSRLAEHMGISQEGCSSVVFTAIDGYSTAISAEEAFDPEICVIAVSLEGEGLGSKEDGGSGPFMMILPKDQFSQRWCKFLAEVNIR